VQPGSGDTLQFMKAGIAEIPDLVVVTKADLGAIAERAARDLDAALVAADGSVPPVHLVAAPEDRGVPELVRALDLLAARARTSDRLTASRSRQADRWVEAAVAGEFGRWGLTRLAADPPGGGSPFRRMAVALAALERHAGRAAMRG
jgi:LAO/AO transport system kinase